MQHKPKITMPNSEWAIMESLWDEAPMTVTDISRIMEHKTGWAKSTTKTIIGRMTRKGLLRYKMDDKTRKYYPTILRSEAVLSETESFLTRLFEGSVGMMVNTLVEHKNISPQELEELRAILDRIDEVK